VIALDLCNSSSDQASTDIKRTCQFIRMMDGMQYAEPE